MRFTLFLKDTIHSIPVQSVAIILFFLPLKNYFVLFSGIFFALSISIISQQKNPQLVRKRSGK